MLTITGPMRSGTSVVARIAHQLGIDMGTAMRMPPAGSGLDPEWEDRSLTEGLVCVTLGVSPYRYFPTFDAYILNRIRHASGNHWGFKNPLLVLYWDEWKQALEKADETLKVVVCSREATFCRQSVSRAAKNPTERWMLEEIQGRIESNLGSIYDSHPELIHFGTPPQEIARRLATLMGLTDYDEATAIRGIRT